MGGWAVLVLTSILFIKSKLQWGRLAPFCNFEILFHKTSVRSNTVRRSRPLNNTRAQTPLLVQSH